MDDRMRPDLLSDLPLSIILVILSLLPIRHAVRTSILSKQWRYVWNSIPHLSFGDNRMKDESDVQKLIRFISQALLLHKGPIHKFQLRVFDPVQSQHMDQWLIFLSRNQIRILILDSECFGSRYLHSSLYSCQYLTHLNLRRHKIPPPPQSFKGFLLLRSLTLHYIKASSTTIESIIARSPLLEELNLGSYGDEGFELTIRAPNLKYFHFSSGSDQLHLCTPLLEELIGDFYEMLSFSIGAESFQGSPWVFRHLRILELSNAPFDYNYVIPAVICLITSSPNLHKLEISSSSLLGDDLSELPCASFWDTESAPDITYDSLKVIKMESFCGLVDEMKLIRFLLARSPVLEKMMYNLHLTVPNQKSLNLMAELLSFRRASANAEILISERLMRSF